MVGRLALASTLGLALPVHGVARADAGTDETTSATSGIGPFTAASYPTELTLRPLTLPMGVAQLTAALSNAHASITLFGTTSSADVQGLGFDLRYGLTDQLEAGVTLPFVLHPDGGWGKQVGLQAHFLALDTAKVDVAPGFVLPLFTEGDAFRFVVFDALTRYLVTDQVYLFGLNDVVDVANHSSTAASLNLNVGIGFQAAPQIALTLSTNLAHLKLSGDSNKNGFIFSDFVPLDVRALVGISNGIDVYAEFADADLENAGTLWVIVGGLAFRLGVAGG